MTNRSALATESETMPENPLTYQDKLASLRQEINRQELNGFICPRTDEYQNEFLAACDERLAWLTGFTGSAGTVIVLEEGAVTLSDARYTLQMKDQIDASLYETADVSDISPGEWVAANAKAGQVIGYDPRLHTPRQIETLHAAVDKAGITLKSVEHNPVDAIWTGRPEKPAAPVIMFPEDLAGQSTKEKRELIAHVVRETDARCCVISRGDSVSWLLNMRGNDMDYSPLTLSCALVYEDSSIDWFIEESRVSSELRASLGPAVMLFPPEELEERLSRAHGRSVMIDRSSSNAWFEETLKSYAVGIIDHKDPCIAPKAIKTGQEQNAIKQAHIREGVALTRLLKWLDEQGASGITELDVADKLEQFRKAEPSYRGQSFATIAGFGPNGAIIHYRPEEQTNRKLENGSLLLLDAGGQYLGQGIAGTTDMTRTIAIGKPSQQMCEDYTAVLKGHIAVARARFPMGTKGVQVDALARSPLWDAGIDYAHGTGHGVGCFLCVHEEAASISPRGETPFEAGMLISNEPGCYHEGQYGIRLENLVFVRQGARCKSTGKSMLQFETITNAPFAPSLIISEHLEADEKEWLNTYHKTVIETLSPYLDNAEKLWLANQCQAV
ncbi:MAG: aminopeptidase P family protein [Alphaproteobacteria bacterium]|nr:aminopeptidase P family protein [Alphaproteobacteria bacterium]